MDLRGVNQTILSLRSAYFQQVEGRDPVDVEQYVG